MKPPYEITSWYIGSGLDGDIEPHHTKLIKAKFFFKNKKGKVKTKTVKRNGELRLNPRKDISEVLKIK